jgi:uncharacterized protein with von Willebrand factor type A (vWA) domain
MNSNPSDSGRVSPAAATRKSRGAAKSVAAVSPDSLAGAVVAFGRLLKDRGVSISPPTVMDALAGISCVGVQNPRDFKTALKATFISRIEEAAIFDRLFEEFWVDHDLTEILAAEGRGEQDTGSMASSPQGVDDSLVVAEAGVSSSQEQEAWDARPYVIYSPREMLRVQDFRDVPQGEDYRMERLIREILTPILRRKGFRRRPVAQGILLDFRRLMRRNILYGREILELPRMKPRLRLKKIVFLCDVSGSMNPYLRFMLRFIKEIQNIPTKVETFVFSTRLTRITSLLNRLPFPRAMREVARTARHWSSGTRIGHCLHEFTSGHGETLLRPSTVVVIHSDGWDRGDVELLRREMSKIQRRAYRVLWINPLMGGASYEPTCRGMRCALPYVDSFLPGHNIEALETVAGTIRSLL